jgi:hypothetical protein
MTAPTPYDFSATNDTLQSVVVELLRKHVAWISGRACFVPFEVG